MNAPRLRSPSARSMILQGRRVLLMVVAILLLGVSCTSDFGVGAPTLDDPSSTGRQLVETYMSLLAHRDVAGLQDFLSDSFMRQGAEGRFATKDDYLNNLPQISNFTIADVTARQAGDALVVRWLFTVDEVIDGKTLQTKPAPRLATFVWDDGQWRLLSHANFNPPA